MARSDLFLIYEANEPRRWGCFESKDSGKIEFLTCTNPLEDKWEITPWPEAKRINAMNRNRTMTAFYFQENNIYQIPLVEHSGQKNIAQVLQLKTFGDEIFWSPVMLHANKFIQNNTLNTIAHWIEQYPSVKTDVVFPEMKQESPYSAQNLFEKLQVQELSLVQKPGETLLDEGHMEIWFYGKHLCYSVNILGQEKSGGFRADIQALIKKGMETESWLKNKEFQSLDDEGQFKKISDSLQKNFPSLRLKLSEAYLNLNSNAQNMILASLSPSWPLLDIEQEGLDVIEEVCRALVFDDNLDTHKIHSIDIFKNVQQFRSFLFLSKINKIYGNNANVKISDVEKFIRYLFLAVMQDRPRFPELEKPVKPLLENEPFYDFDLIYLSLNHDNPLLSKVFLKYLIKGLKFLSYEEVVELKNLFHDYFDLFQNDMSEDNQINKKYDLKIFEQINNKDKLLEFMEFLSKRQEILLNEKFDTLIKKPDFEQHIPEFFSNPMSLDEKRRYVTKCMKQKHVSDYTFLQRLTKEFTHDFEDLKNFFQYLEPDSYFLFESLVTELCMNVEQLIELYKIKKQNVFFEIFGEELLNHIQNESDLIYLFENIPNKEFLNLVLAHPNRLFELIGFYPKVFLDICKKEEKGFILEKFLQFIQNNDLNFFDIFISLNEDQKKILLENHAQKLISDIQSFDDFLKIIHYLNDEQLTMAFQRYPIELNAELLNDIAKTVSPENLTKILNFNAKKLFGVQLNTKEMNSFLSQADKKIQNYLINYQVRWLMQNISNADELLEFIVILNNRLFIKTQIDIIKEYVTEPSVFYSYRKILSKNTPKLNQVFIKTFYPSFKESAYQDCLKELKDYEIILTQRERSFFTIQSTNKNKIRHVKALMAILNGEAPTLESPALDKMDSLKKIYQKYQVEVFAGLPFENLLHPVSIKSVSQFRAD